MEIGIDSLERRYYRPAFKFSFQAAGTSSWRWNAGLMYEQRLNGRLQGALDFWLTTGLERGLGGPWNLEASVRHLCRHATSRENPVILDVNEVLGLVRLREKGVVLGLGFGSYVGKTGGFRHLAAADLLLSDVLRSGISFEGEVEMGQLFGMAL